MFYLAVPQGATRGKWAHHQIASLISSLYSPSMLRTPRHQMNFNVTVCVCLSLSSEQPVLCSTRFSLHSFCKENLHILDSVWSKTAVKTAVWINYDSWCPAFLTLDWPFPLRRAVTPFAKLHGKDQGDLCSKPPVSKVRPLIEDDRADKAPCGLEGPRWEKKPDRRGFCFVCLVTFAS